MILALVQDIHQSVKELCSKKRLRSGRKDDYSKFFEFFDMKTNAMFVNLDIERFEHHRNSLKTALNKMCKSIIAAKKDSKKDSTKGDEIQLVQEKLHIFLADILPVADAIIIGIEDTAIPSHSNSSSSTVSAAAPSKLIIEREKAFKIDRAGFEVRRTVSGGSADFSFQHRDYADYSLTLFEAKKTQLRLETVNLTEVQEEIAQAGIQMLGAIQELERFTKKPIGKYRSMLTNGLVWMQVMMGGRRNGKMKWVHSEPIVVIEEEERKRGGTKYSVQQGAVDLVVDHILSVLVTARCILQLVKKEWQKLVSNSKVLLFYMPTACSVCMFVCMFVFDYSSLHRQVDEDDDDEQEEEEEDDCEDDANEDDEAGGDDDEEEENVSGGAMKKPRYGSNNETSNNNDNDNNKNNKKSFKDTDRFPMLLPLNEYTLRQWTSRMAKQ